MHIATTFISETEFYFSIGDGVDDAVNKLLVNLRAMDTPYAHQVAKDIEDGRSTVTVTPMQNGGGYVGDDAHDVDFRFPNVVPAVGR